jgi:hypothetical protein
MEFTAGSTKVCFVLLACALDVDKREDDNEVDGDGLNEEAES